LKKPLKAEESKKEEKDGEGNPPEKLEVQKQEEEVLSLGECLCQPRTAAILIMMMIVFCKFSYFIILYYTYILTFSNI